MISALLAIAAAQLAVALLIGAAAVLLRILR